MQVVKPLVSKAHGFAAAAHGSIGQKRKYTGAPYITHPEKVLFLFQNSGGKYRDDPCLQAVCLLHDVVEDTPVTADLLSKHFPMQVVEYVLILSKDESFKGTREQRKTHYFARVKQGGGAAQTIKLADLSHNSVNLAHYDPEFARVFAREFEQAIWLFSEAVPEMLELARVALRRLERGLAVKLGEQHDVHSESGISKDLPA